MTSRNRFFKLSNSLSIFLKHARHAIFFIGAFLWLDGCRNKTLKDYGHDMKALNKEVKNRKIHRVSEPELQKWSLKKGSDISRIAQKYLNRASNKGIESKKIASHQEFIKLFPLPSIDSLAKAHQVDIQALSFKQATSANLYDIEAKLLRQYKNEEIDLKPLTKSVENHRKLLFIAPIKINGPAGIWSIHFKRSTIIKQVVEEREKKKKKKRKNRP